MASLLVEACHAHYHYAVESYSLSQTTRESVAGQETLSCRGRKHGNHGTSLRWSRRLVLATWSFHEVSVELIAKAARRDPIATAGHAGIVRRSAVANVAKLPGNSAASPHKCPHS